MASPFWSEKCENSQQKRVLTTFFVILGGHGPDSGQSRINFAKINQNYEHFQIILEQFGDEFNQNRSPKSVVFAKKMPKCQRQMASPLDPRL